MAVFSTNQNRQLYVAESVATSTPSALGEVLANVTSDGKYIYYQHYGAGGLTRSDLIPLENITSAKITYPAAMATYLKTATVTLNSDVNGGAPVAGQDYILRIYIHNYLAIGDENVTAKYGVVHATSSMDAATFYEKLAESLTKNFSREVSQLLTFEATDSGVVITEVEQPWILGTYAQESVNFTVVATTIEYDGDEVIWAETDDNGYITVENSDTAIGNGKKIADLEYFCHGERGDQYRNVGFPNVIFTTYEVDPSAEYYVLDIHYSFKDDGVSAYKSEKDLTFVSTDVAVLTTLSADLGVTVETVTGETSTTEE